MKKILSLLLILAFQVYPVIRIWSADGVADICNGDNYEPTGAILTTDTLRFDGTKSTFSGTTSSRLSVAYIDIQPGYSGTFEDGGYGIVLSNGANFSGTGNLILRDTLTVTGNSAKVFVGADGTATTTDCSFKVSGVNDSLDIRKTIYLNRVIIDDNKQVALVGDSALYAFSNRHSLVMGNSATLTVNTPVWWTLNASDTIFKIGSNCILNGFAINSIKTYSESNPTLYIPAFTYTGTGTFVFNTWTAGRSYTVSQIGSINVSAGFDINAVHNNSHITYNTNGNDITVNGALRVGISPDKTAKIIMNCGNSTITTTSLDNAYFSSNLDTCTINYQTSRWIIAGNVTFNNKHVHYPGTASMSIKGNCTFTANGKEWYDLSLDTSTATLTFADTTRLHDFTVTAGNTTRTDGILIASGDVTIDGTGTHTLLGCQMTGDNATKHIGSTTETVTAKSAVIDWRGTNGIFDDDKGITVRAMNVSAGASITTTGSAILIFQGLSNGISWIMGDNSTATIDSRIRISNSGFDLISIGNNCVVNGNGEIYFGGGASPNTLPKFTYSGTGIIHIYNFATNGSRSITLTGDLNSSGEIRIYRNGTGGDFTFDQNNQIIKCSEMKYGCMADGGIFRAKFNDSITVVNNVNASMSIYNLGADTIDLDSSVWNVGGNWTSGSAHVVNPGSSIFDFTGTTATTITSAGKPFNVINIRKGNKARVTLADSLQANTVIVDSGTFACNAKNIRVNSVIFDGADSVLCRTASTNLILTDTSNAGVIKFRDSCVYLVDSMNLICQGSDTIHVSGGRKVSIRSFLPANGETYWFHAGDTLRVHQLPDSSWNGSVDEFISFRSKDPGFKYYIQTPSADTVFVKYMNPKDCHAVGVISAADGTSVNGGNNVNWVFHAPSEKPPIRLHFRTRFGF